MIWEGLVTGSKEIKNFPTEGEVQFHTDADVTIAFWFPKKGVSGDWGDPLSVAAPGDWVGVGSSLALVTGTANIIIKR